MEIRGAKALVTGASRGIGKAIAEALVAEGALVWGTSRDPEGAQWSEGVTPLKLDLKSPDAIEAFWHSEAIEFDIVVNNAGSGAFGRIEELEGNALEAQIDLLLMGPLMLTRLAWPGLRERKGCLVNVSSLAVEFPIPFMSAYNAGKAGLSAFTESLLLESRENGPLVIDFRLGDFRTRFNAAVERFGGDEEGDGCLEGAWDAMERHMKMAPSPRMAAKKLIRCLKADQRGTIRAGSFFQARVAPWFARFGSQALIRRINARYYGIKGGDS